MKISESDLDYLARDFLDRVQERLDLAVDRDGFIGQAEYSEAWEAIDRRVDEYINAID